MRLMSFVALCTLGLSAQAAELTLADAVYVHQLDNQEVKNYLWNKTDKLTLSPGKHQLKVSYSKIFDDGFDSHTKVTVDEHWITIQIPAEGQYQLTTPELIDIDAAKAWQEAPSFVLEGSKGKALATLAPRPEAPPKAPADPAAAQSMAEQQLQYWWSQADDATRQRFKDWLNQQH
ncbi:DUF2057 family protein [Gallaecimonas xiamenensis]|uniref:DUF2057 domain-containing protein n=1 Tax=Gallaecimonas xiamenensis 3-C-1 TaxID=745411 RepID=K2JU91_9GAMM|nr:DUF2057 family protein [Gallaecimonas xiamenensis]EKE68735.1 hypothetical protein B3C1_16275 [Gallaecimonas xiamenensis 3-C-1]